MRQHVPEDRLPANVKKFIQMEAQGCQRPEILKEVFGITDIHDNAVHAADCKMSRWRKHPLYHQVWDEEIKKQDYIMMSRARAKLRNQLESSNEWLVNKAANDIIAQGNRHIYGEDEKALHVKIEGMPEIGSPDDD